MSSTIYPKVHHIIFPLNAKHAQLHKSSTTENTWVTSLLASSKYEPITTERRVVEKNRRNRMKLLYSNLYSLLPKQTFKAPLRQTNQIDEAINYIKSQEESKLQKLKEKKESLMRTRKRSYATACVNVEGTRSAKAPQIKIQEIDSTLEVVLISGLENHQFMFYEIIRLLDEEHSNVVHANFSTLGDSTFHIVRAEIGKSMSEFGAARITEKLNRFVNGSTSDQESQQEYF